ncbi:MAG: hypothetical protein HZC44_09005 [Geobacter sp.]|nr:hypothetical protein [Geobacter sp.]
MKLFNWNASALVVAGSLTMLLSACGTTKNFAVDSNPKGALVVAKAKEGYPIVKGATVYKDTPLCETPTTLPITFMADTTKATLIAEKRGYTSASYDLDKTSAETVHFALQKIDGVPEATFKKEDLSSAQFTLLPLYVEVHVRSGVGRLDSLDLSPEASQKATDELTAELLKSLAGNSSHIHPAAIDAPLKTDWQALTPDFNKYVLKLDSNRLPYYSLPPYITANVEGFKPFLGRLADQPGNDRPYLLYVWSKCITETAGRQVGNVLFSILGAATAGYSTAAGTGFQHIYDPSAFAPDSGTLVMMCVIDTKTSEVVHIEQRVFPDITDEDALKAMASAIGAFPTVAVKKE